MQIRPSFATDFEAILEIINDAAQAYRGVIPSDCWHEPYMSAAELTKEIACGVNFWVVEDEGRPLSVMGIQDKEDVALVRHAYTVTVSQRKGAATMLLRHVATLTGKPLLIGTWADASWAIDFYKRNGFEVVSDHDKNLLLGEYWAVPTRQVETSIVLADSLWLKVKG